MDGKGSNLRKAWDRSSEKNEKRFGSGIEY
jgi:hypothetical protein